QVLLNDQSTRNCAWGDTATCTAETRGTAGWARRTPATVDYRLHEFGLLAPSHSFTHWPGFSLNPALWDLARLDGRYRRKYGRKLEFDPTDIR
ncbi:unnamed protein product, partial [Hapterophycus canaliculatus]